MSIPETVAVIKSSCIQKAVISSVRAMDGIRALRHSGDPGSQGGASVPPEYLSRQTWANLEQGHRRTLALGLPVRFRTPRPQDGRRGVRLSVCV